MNGFKKYFNQDNDKVRVEFRGIAIQGINYEYQVILAGFYPVDSVVQEDKRGQFVELYLADEAKVMFEYRIIFNHGGSVMTSHNYETHQPFQSAAEAQMKAVKDVVEMTQNGNDTIKTIEVFRICRTCSGRGEIGERKGKRVVRYVTKKCPVCKGKNSETQVI